MRYSLLERDRATQRQNYTCYKTSNNEVPTGGLSLHRCNFRRPIEHLPFQTLKFYDFLRLSQSSGNETVCWRRSAARLLRVMAIDEDDIPLGVMDNIVIA